MHHPAGLHKGYHVGRWGKVGIIGWQFGGMLPPPAHVIVLRTVDGMARQSATASDTRACTSLNGGCLPVFLRKIFQAATEMDVSGERATCCYTTGGGWTNTMLSGTGCGGTPTCGRFRGSSVGITSVSATCAFSSSGVSVVRSSVSSAIC